MSPVIDLQQAQSDIFERLLRLRTERVPHTDTTRLRKAYSDACSMYGEQMHWTSEKMIDHCLGVLELYLPFDPDDDGVIAALMHHALDTQLWSLADLERTYGMQVRSTVSSIHLLSHVTTHEHRLPVEHLRMMFLRVADDPRAVLLILCDYVRKLDMMHGLTPELRRRLCRDVLQLFAPVAARLGMYTIKHRLESRAFPVLYPVDATRIAEQLNDLHSRYGNFLLNACDHLRQALASQGIEAIVESREKQIYSIFHKMQQKTVSHVEDLYDLFALRVIVESEADCYQALGILHRIGYPVAHRFKDYIGFPKPNGYRSLHTTLMRLPGVPEGVLLEVQIRTHEMHRQAQLGIAAHWNYKEGGGEEFSERRARIHDALLHQSSDAESVKVPLADHIFVLTPHGDILELPEGATPLDFAFGVHTMVGLSFKAARVNGSVVPIDYALENGDVVEVIRHKEPRPSVNWIGILKTASGRSRLKRYLALHDREASMQRGREILNAEFARRGLPSLDPDLSLLRLHDGSNLSVAERSELLVRLAQGAITVSGLVRQLDLLRPFLVSQKIERTPHALSSAIVFEDGLDMPVRFAQCCKADLEQGCAISGIAGRDGFVRIHKRECKMIRYANPERSVNVKWGKK
jgi:GTP diphosphokinase / guanosine-3',5'-bis(diphosphate) 3'-diphosphatase